MNKLSAGSQGSVTPDKATVIEFLLPSVFRVIVSLDPAGFVDLDAVAFSSPDEGGSYIHARGLSVHHVFRHVTVDMFIALVMRAMKGDVNLKRVSAFSKRVLQIFSAIDTIGSGTY
ncbi:Mediator of RNA polymerase II transcription subunit 27 [Euphorbia peplus]|nr:Mediator of RNA polymerase II transcription subunit 27 [Euphorbia peplus]